MPTNPQFVGSYITAGLANDIQIRDTCAYIAYGTSGLRIIDISTPSNPQEIGYFDTPGNAFGVFLAGNFSFVADNRALRVIDISNPSNPQEYGFYTTPSEAHAIYFQDSYIYVADWMCGLQVYKAAEIGIEEANIRDLNCIVRLLQNPVKGDQIKLYVKGTFTKNPVLSLYDIQGRKIRFLECDKAIIDGCSINMPVADIPNGIYFLNFTAGNYQEIKKIVLLK